MTLLLNNDDVHRVLTMKMAMGALEARQHPGGAVLAVAGKVYESAQGLGHELPTEWFLQDIRD
jgi:hypothetical protein